LVLDCTGIYRNPNWAGDGGIPAPGERAAARRISYELDDVAGAQRARYRGKRVLLVGAGHSAAHSALALAALAREEPGAEVLWAVGGGAPPCVEVPNDPLPERARVARAANDLAAGGSTRFHFLAHAVVDAIAPAGDGLTVRLRVGADGFLEVAADRI